MFLAACSDKKVESGGSSAGGESSEIGGDSSVNTSYTVTFVCEGQENIVYTVKSGDVLTDVPTLPTENGYVFSWQGYDLTKPITSSVTLTAVKTPNTYTVTFQLALKSAVIETTRLTVRYGENYAMPTPTCTGYVFVGWTVADTGDEFETTGVYTLLTNVELVAEWKIDETSSDNWGDGQ